MKTGLLSLSCLVVLSVLFSASIAVPRTGAAPKPVTLPQGLSAADWAGIQQARDEAQYPVQPVPERPGTWRAENPGQGWTAELGPRGFRVSPDSGTWSWGLELKSYGCGEAQVPPQGSGAPAAVEGGKCRLQRDAVVEEWWVNDGRGLEHGFVIRRRPAGPSGAPLTLHLDTAGTLLPRVAADGAGITFCDARGMGVVDYAGLKVWDAAGRVLTARFESAGGTQVRLRVEDSAAQYPVTIDPVAQQAFVKAPSGGAFGKSIAMSGDTVVVGTPGESSDAPGVNSVPNGLAPNAGAAYVFVRSAGVWTQQAFLKCSAPRNGDNFGASVAIQGDTVVVGAPEEDSSSRGVNSVPEILPPFFIGSGSGAAYVFVRNGTQWSQQAYLKASNTREYHSFGGAVAVSGDTVAVAAPNEDSSSSGINGLQDATSQGYSSGAVYVFVRNGTQWSQQAYIKSFNTSGDDNLGRSLALSGDTLIAGAPNEDSPTSGINSTPSDAVDNNSGAAYVFVRSGTQWSQQAYLKAANAGVGDRFGTSVALSGETAVVGAPMEDSNTTGVNTVPSDPSAAFDSGAVYVFVRSGTQWSQQAYIKAGNAGELDWFGETVAISGNTLVAGARTEDSSTTGVNSTPADVNTFFNSGAAYVFTRAAGTWSQQAYLKAHNTGNGDNFGASVGVSGDTVVVGAPGEDSSTSGINPPFNNSASGSGAAYFFNGAGVSGPDPAAQLSAALAAVGLTGASAFPQAIPYGDGVSNLLKFAFNMNLGGPDSHAQVPGGPAGGLPAISPAPGSVLRFEFVRRTGSGLVYTPEKTTDPSNPAAWAPLTDTPTVTPIDASWERVVYEEPANPAVLPQCFGRVKVTIP